MWLVHTLCAMMMMMRPSFFSSDGTNIAPRANHRSLGIEARFVSNFLVLYLSCMEYMYWSTMLYTCTRSMHIRNFLSLLLYAYSCDSFDYDMWVAVDTSIHVVRISTSSTVRTVQYCSNCTEVAVPYTVASRRSFFKDCMQHSIPREEGSEEFRPRSEKCEPNKQRTLKNSREIGIADSTTYSTRLCILESATRND